MVSVFVSHSRSDADIAANLAEVLREEGLRPWLAEEELQAGSDIEDSIPAAIRAADAVVFLIDEKPAGRWQDIERQTAVRATWENPKTRLVPLLLPGATSTPPFLREWRAVRLANDRSRWATSFRQVARMLKQRDSTRRKPDWDDLRLRLSRIRDGAAERQ